MAGGKGERSLLRRVAEAAAAAIFLTTFIITGVGISGDSMTPTLRSGERALVPRYETWLHRLGIGSFGVGDVVYFPAPEQTGAAFCPWFCTNLIKRIVAVGGERVAIRHGQLTVNGVSVEERYLGSMPRGGFWMSETVVPPGYVFVLGDNRTPFGSYDSRAFGPIPVRTVEGRAAWVVWPLLRREQHGEWRWNVRRIATPARAAATAAQP